MPDHRRLTVEERLRAIRAGERPAHLRVVPRWETVGNPPRIVMDDCWRCGAHGPITVDAQLCGSCDMATAQ